jgi:LacI family transcriptional regulator
MILGARGRIRYAQTGSCQCFCDSLIAHGLKSFMNQGLPMTAIPQVAVLVDTSRSYGRDIVRGIRRYVAEQGPWSLYLEPRDLRSSFPEWLKNWPGDGILARTIDPALLKELKATKLPVIEMRTTTLKHPFPFVGMDNHIVGRRVAQHFLDRGFRRFACYLDNSERFFQLRCASYRQTLSEQGHECSVFETTAASGPTQRWDEHQKKLADWLSSLQKPCAVFASNDQLGFWILDAARRASISVPEQIAVIGAENDKTLCDTAWPPLSSVQLRGQNVGHTAAKLLHTWMQTQQQPTGETLLPPGDIIVRQSSDIVAVEDERIAKALHFIRHQAITGIGVDEVARSVALSRSALERRMKTLIGRSPGEEIIRIRFSHVERLLAQTDLTLEAIAERTGFQHMQYMAEAFRKRAGITPGEYRRQNRV